MSSFPAHPASSPRRRKLRALVITMPGSAREANMKELFSQPEMKEQFEVSFAEGVNSRNLNNRFKFLSIANEAGLIPQAEWNALAAAHEDPKYCGPKVPTNRVWDCLNNVPVKPGRRGSQEDVKLHYSKEIWQKAKSINRGRAVLACTLAHLIALKRFVAEDFDVMLEDNVRVPMADCANRMRQARESSLEYKRQRQNEDQSQNSSNGVKDDEFSKVGECHLRFLGWLGSTPNLQWMFERQAKQKACPPHGKGTYPVFPFPTTQDIVADLSECPGIFPEPDPQPMGVTNGNGDSANGNDTLMMEETKTAHRKPGGNPVWGSYAYWISAEGYQALLRVLQNDVGALLWKGKRMRYYAVKPMDKVLPRQIMKCFGQESVHMTQYPAFFRAPMLTSKIHAKWDPEFCKSTEYQLQQSGGLSWSDLWLNEWEREIVAYYNKHGTWITLGKLEELRKGEASKELSSEE